MFLKKKKREKCAESVKISHPITYFIVPLFLKNQNVFSLHKVPSFTLT